MLIEVLVSALILAIVASGVLALLQTTTRSAGEQRDGAKGYAVAQEDQARLRAMQLGALNNLNQETHPKLDGTIFTVKSTAVFINNKASTTTCSGSGEETSPDYVQLTTKVTWPGMEGRKPILIHSIFSPVNGSVDPTTGALAISALNSEGGGLSGVGLELTGAKTATATTDANGCAIFVEMPEGNYTLKPSAPGLIDANGKPPAQKTVGIAVAMEKPVELRYDLPGSLVAPFVYRVDSTSEFKESSQSSVMLFNSGMTTARAFSSVGGVPAPSIAAKELFPFTSPYAVYAGSCTANNPNPSSDPKAAGAAAVTPITVPRGGAAPLPVTGVQVPALNLTVKTGSTPIVGAKVKITGTCSFARTYTTIEKTIVKGAEKITEKGVLADPGLPWGAYEVCASANVSGVNRRIKKSITVQTLTSATALNLDVSGTGSESNATC